MTSGEVIREARLLAGLSQYELADRAGVPRPSIVRWERGTVEPGFETVRRLLRACGFDLSLVRYEPDETVDDRLSERLQLTPQERLRLMLGAPDTPR
jgi:transcriptional regulator with XRE-family HTH domain